MAHSKDVRGTADGAPRWVASWATSPQLIDPQDGPPAPGLAGHTLRQRVYVSVGGQRLRVRFTNEFGDRPVTLRAAALALSGDGDRVLGDSSVALRFDGANGVTIPPGAALDSDPVRFDLPAQSGLTISVHFGEVPGAITGHAGSRTTSYLSRGNAVGCAKLEAPSPVERWFYLQRVEVADPVARVAVCVGDSLTDGRGSTTDNNDRWPDVLSRRLRANQKTAQSAVVNAGIGGNAVLRGGLGPTLLERFDRDALQQPGVAWVVLLAGVNDIGTDPADAECAGELIAAYQRLIDDAHGAGVRVYGVPLLPFGGSFYDSPRAARARQAVNDWIRESGVFDAVLDLEGVLGDPRCPGRLLSDFDSGDQLHLSAAGYRAMAEAIDLGLFVTP